VPPRVKWLIALACAAIPAAAPAAAGAATETVPGEVIVRYASGTSASERAASRSRVGASFEESLGISQSQLLRVRGSVSDAVDRLNRQRDVLYAEPNYVYRASAPPSNDARFAELWGLRNVGQSIAGIAGVAGIDTRALGAWDTTRGAGALIAVADTGVDLEHPDVDGNLASPPGADFVDGGSPDDENDQRPPGCLPDDLYHGTHVAGTAAAEDGNGIGIAGVAPDARILAVRVLDRCGVGSSAVTAQGIQYAVQRGADVINLSLGGPFSNVVSNAVDAANAANAVVVAAAGNDNQDNDTEFVEEYPCELPQANLICVASINNDGARSGFSNYGPTTVDVGAPGRDILSAQGTTPPAYQYLNGTSMAAPHVAGVAALGMRTNPTATDSRVVQAIKASARRLPSLIGWIASGGIVDAAATVRLLRPPRPAALPAPAPPKRASFRRSKRSIRASRTGRFRFSFTAGAGLRGRITLKTVRRVRPRSRGRRRIATFANKTFTVPGSGRVTVRFKLSRRNRRILKRYKRLRISVAVKLRNSANLTSTARVRITLRAPRPPRS
jgi:subtilisin family serine protease